LDAGAGLSGSIAPGSGSVGAAAGGLIVAGVTGRRLGARLALAAGTERELPLGTGRVRWRRLVAGLGPAVRLEPVAPVMVDLHLEALVAAVSAAGQGFTNDLGASSADPGVGAGARVLFGRGAVVPWLDLSGAGWLRAERAFATPDGISVTL